MGELTSLLGTALDALREAPVDTLRRWAAILVVVALPPALVYWYAVHPFVAFWRRLGARASVAILFVALGASFVGTFRIREILLGTDFGFSAWTAAVAALLVGAAGVLQWRRRKQLTARTLVGIPEFEPDGGGGQLLTEGVYSRSRNPRYVEVMLAISGYALFSNYLGAYLVTLAAVPGIHLVVLLEERELRDRFGEQYREYCERVPRYW